MSNKLKVGDLVVINNYDRKDIVKITAETKTEWIIKNSYGNRPSRYNKKTLKAYGTNGFSSHNTYYMKKATQEDLENDFVYSLINKNK